MSALAIGLMTVLAGLVGLAVGFIVGSSKTPPADDE